METVNPATETLFGYAATELIGQNVSMLMPSPDREQHGRYLKNYDETHVRKVIGIGREIVAVRKDGSTFPAHMDVSEFQLNGQQYYTGFLRDLSEWKELEKSIKSRLEVEVAEATNELMWVQADLIHSEKYSTLGKVSGSIAHEIRNPLNAIKTSVYYLLNARKPETKKVHEHLDCIDQQVSVINNVITALTDVAMLPDADPRPVNLTEVLKESVSAADLPSDICVHYQLATQPVTVPADKSQLGIAIGNLIRNASDAMQGSGTLKLQTETVNQVVQIMISDTGDGIAPELQKSIFEPLFSTKTHGMGLGLSITLAIIEKNKGSIKLDQGYQDGCRWIIELQLQT